MNTPFNTGKVAIGSRYERPLRVEMSRDMERLQRGLLEQRLEKQIRAHQVIKPVTPMVVPLRSLIDLYFAPA